MKTLGIVYRYPSVVFVGVLAGLLGVASFFVVTPDTAAEYLSPNGFITDQGLADLDHCRLLALTFGCYLLLRSGILGVRILHGSFARFRRSPEGESTRLSLKLCLDFLLARLARLALWCSVVLAMFFVVYTIYYVVADANWVFGDEHLLLTSTLVGKPTPTFVNPAMMRFAPLAFEYNIFIPFGNAPYVYYSWEALKFLGIVVATLLSMLVVVHKYVSVTTDAAAILKSAACLLVVCLIVSPGLFFVISEVITYEPVQMLCVSLFILTYLLATKTIRLQSWTYLSALAFGTLALYCKEPTFGAIFVVVALPLLLDYRSLDWKRRGFYLAMAASCLMFLVMFYVFIILPRGGLQGGYHAGRATDFTYAKFVSFLVSHQFWLILLAVPIAGYRLTATVVGLVKKNRLDQDLLVFDGLLYGGLAYVFAFCFLGMMEIHYFVPAHVFIVPAVFYYFCRTVAAGQASSICRWCALLVVVVLPASYVVQVYDIYDWQQEYVGLSRRSHIPALQAIIPEVERSHLVLVVPEARAFASEFEKTAVLHWEYYTITTFVEFLSERNLVWHIYDPDHLFEQTWLRLLGEHELVHSLAELSEDKPVLALMASAVLKGAMHAELRNFSEVAATQGVFPVTFRRISR